MEGVDYTILYYGGAILSHHTFLDDEDGADDLVRALSMSRSFAVVIDSDRTRDRPQLRATKTRIREEVERSGGFCWITEGREIENYLSVELQSILADQFSYLRVASDKRDQVLEPSKAVKVEVARKAVTMDDGAWPFDLKRQIQSLIEYVTSAA